MGQKIAVEEAEGYYIWEYSGVFKSNIGIIWDKESADLIQKALDFYAEHHKED